MRAMLAIVIFALYAGAAFPPPAEAAGKKVKIHVQVIEATTKSTAFDERLAKLKDSIIGGYTGAKLLDELSTSVEEDASVSLEILDKKILRILVREIEEDGTIKLSVEIEAFNFAMRTSHKKGEATAVLAFKSGKTEGMFVAVTPTLAP